MAHRKYELKQRAISKEDTRRRILEATVELHAVLGPAATTISAIAERAGVERLTVYRHFPTMASLFEACGPLTMEAYAPPHIAPPAPDTDGLDFLEATLLALYGYYEQREAAIALFLTDAERIPELREIVERNWVAYFDNAGDVLLAALAADSSDDLRAVISQAVDFWAWRSLHRQGLSNAEAARLQRRIVAALDPRPFASSSG